jgi:hypothetical protein
MALEFADKNVLIVDGELTFIQYRGKLSAFP